MGNSSHSCILENTIIRTKNSGRCPIELIDVLWDYHVFDDPNSGDRMVKVTKHSGDIEPLESAFGSAVYPLFRLSSVEVGSIFELKVVNKSEGKVLAHRTLNCTPFHPVLNDKGSIVPASLTSTGDFLLVMGKEGIPEFWEVETVTSKFTTQKRVFTLGLASREFCDNFREKAADIDEGFIKSVDDAERIIAGFEQKFENQNGEDMASILLFPLMKNEEDKQKIKQWRSQSNLPEITYDTDCDVVRFFPYSSPYTMQNVVGEGMAGSRNNSLGLERYLDHVIFTNGIGTGDYTSQYTLTSLLSHGYNPLGSVVNRDDITKSGYIDGDTIEYLKRKQMQKTGGKK